MQRKGQVNNAITIAIGASLLLNGCAATSKFVGHLDAAPHSYDVDGEKVEVKLLTMEEVINDTRLKDKGILFDQLFPTDKKVRLIPLLGVIAPALAGYAVDFIKGQLDAEAKRYEATYNGSVVVDDYFEAKKDKPDDENSTSTTVLHYWAVEIVRTTDATRNAREKFPAFDFICALAPSKDKAFIKVIPLYLNVKESKAKVAWPTDKVTVEVNLASTGTWIDADGKSQSKQLATVNWKKTGLVVHDSEQLMPTNYKPIGFLPVPPLSFSEGVDGKFKMNADGGIVQYDVGVTERDESMAQQYIERAAKFVGDKKQSVLDYVKKATSQPTAP